jgi:serine/threonine-protein kinase HipA
MMTLAAAVGIDVPEVRLVATADIGRLPQNPPEGFGQSLAVRRFDRPRPGERVHIEDFAQVFGVYPEAKYRRASYGSIARVLWREAGEDAVIEYTRRLVFNVLIGNADAHLKNWSLIYPDGRTPKLAPGYDFLSTTLYLPDENAALKFARTKKVAELTLGELIYMAAKAGIPEALAKDTATEAVDRFHQVWGQERAHLPISSALEAEIERLLGLIPLAQGR